MYGCKEEPEMIKLVDTTELKREITFFMGTGYQADDILCKDILNCIDRHTLESPSTFDEGVKSK
jgi:hypothetical protein